DYKISNLGLVIGVLELQKIIEDKFNHNQDGRLLASFGELFSQNIRVYVYPALEPETHQLVTAGNMNVPDKIKFLYQYLLDSKQVVPIHDFAEENLYIYPNEVRDKINSQNHEWEKQVPDALVRMIKSKSLFGYHKA